MKKCPNIRLDNIRGKSIREIVSLGVKAQYMNKLIKILIALYLLCTGVSYASSSPVSAKIVDEILFNGIVVKPSSDVKGVIEQLGQPLKKITKSIQNKITGIYDEITYLFYDEAEIWIYTTKGLEKNWSKVSEVVITGNKYTLPNNLKIGLNEEEVTNILGNASMTQNSTTWYYFPSDDEPHLQLILEFQNRILKEFRWSCMP